ncbi:EscI/YscI/HrpB family type III secretion system inner rod protein [Sodalis sp. dw_96]|uniref:EscI/YscI/HrpB family type III secretion system inner rod protein n=1 Tax=Sodalis sp. dw_96 TaxID=2719794 RepID=UPI001BD3B756|nr:EscI/YscI/HrpB family type III secretion system inner rod protein [Sodalis sp. dw_96]
MKITAHQPDLALSTANLAATAGQSPETDDVHYFSAQLNAPAAASSASASASASSDFLSGIVNTVSDTQSAQKRAFKDLETASRSSNELDFNQASATLSNFYIENLMNAKIVSKGIQSLDKLTNLQ